MQGVLVLLPTEAQVLPGPFRGPRGHKHMYFELGLGCCCVADLKQPALISKNASASTSGVSHNRPALASPLCSGLVHGGGSLSPEVESGHSGPALEKVLKRQKEAALHAGQAHHGQLRMVDTTALMHAVV
jgi:hypothetical protein